MLVKSDCPEMLKQRVYLFGGAGNQLFQLAFALELSKIKKVKVFVDGSTIFGRNCILEHLTLPTNIEYVRGVSKTKLFHSLASKKLMPHIQNESKKKSISAYRGSYYGYYQSCVYVQNNFQEMVNILGQSKSMSNIAKNNNQVAIHIRGSDYLNNLTYIELDERYYNRALRAVLLEEKISQVCIFTDDPNHAIKIINTLKDSMPKEIEFKIDNGVTTEIKVLKRMAQYKYFISANSTFGWWGGWLVANNGGRVFYPSLHYKRMMLSSSFYPANWQEISAE
jgi:hypothetical protein